MTTQGIERIPDSMGYLVINEDGAVVSVSEKKCYYQINAKLLPSKIAHTRKNV